MYQRHDFCFGDYNADEPHLNQHGVAKYAQNIKSIINMVNHDISREASARELAIASHDSVNGGQINKDKMAMIVMSKYYVAIEIFRHINLCNFSRCLQNSFIFFGKYDRSIQK